jgi:hypothetical protein
MVDIKQYFPEPIVRRSKRYRETDIAAVRWIAQCAVNVELFTIPLYMTSMYSIAGYHQITSKSNDFYKGRRWPGMATAVLPSKNAGDWPQANQEAFNTIFSVFIEEMLHLQMAANIAAAIGLTSNTDPKLDLTFTSKDLQKDYGWICYGPKQTVIPYIVDLKDTDVYANVVVNFGPLNDNSINLFLAIEEPTESAHEKIVRNKDRYFPAVPFADFDPSKIMFGTIGWMYRCYRAYLEIEYDDGTTLWDAVFNPKGQQNDLFNNFSFPGHPMREFMRFETTIALTDKNIARNQAFIMMEAITDQGEGSTLKTRLRYEHETNALQAQGLSAAQQLEAVRRKYRADPDSLTSDYPNYSDTGKQQPQSRDGFARHANDDKDHFECFQNVRKLMAGPGGVVTWDKANKAGRWTEGDFKTPDYTSDNPHKLPTPKQIADALNNLYNQRADMYPLLSQAAVGAIKGVTSVLNDYWNPKTPGNTVAFPFPSMGGTADRMATCWAVFGEAPDLTLGIGDPSKLVVHHACQALSTYGDDRFKATNTCAEVTVYHTCRGSNACKAMGGCGFVQPSSGGGNCSTLLAVPAVSVETFGRPSGHNCSAVVMRAQGGVLDDEDKPAKDHYTAPSANICAGFGGCAVPISACQLYPRDGTMDVYSITAMMCGSTLNKFVGTLPFKAGNKVEDIAYQAFLMWAKSIKQNPPPPPPPEPPAPNDIRLAFPPST